MNLLTWQGQMSSRVGCGQIWKSWPIGLIGAGAVVCDRKRQDEMPGTVTGRHGDASGGQDEKPQGHTEPASSWCTAFESLTLLHARFKADA